MKRTEKIRRIRPARLISALLTAALILSAPFAATSCGSDNGADTGTDASTGAGTGANTASAPDFEDICAAAAGALGDKDKSEYVPREDSYIENFISIVPSDYNNCLILVSTEGGSISEYGVIESAPGGAADAAKAIEAYFEFYRSIWDDRYTPEEYPKLRDAEVRTYDGRFTVYAMLGADEREAFFDAVGKLFT